MNTRHVTFYRKIVHFQNFEYANELICIIIRKDRFYLAWNVEIVLISYQKHNELQCKGVTLLKFNKMIKAKSNGKIRDFQQLICI